MATGEQKVEGPRMNSLKLFASVATAWMLYAPMVAAAPARNCYEGQAGNGCPWKTYFKEKDLVALSCQNLAHMRNQTYHERGYCFKKAYVKILA